MRISKLRIRPGGKGKRVGLLQKIVFSKKANKSKMIVLRLSHISGMLLFNLYVEKK